MSVQAAAPTVSVPQQAAPADPPLTAPAPAPVRPAALGPDRPLNADERQFLLGFTALFVVLSAIIVAFITLSVRVW